MGQITFSEAEYQNKKRQTRREIFLERMDKLIPWNQMEKKAAHYYPNGQKCARIPPKWRETGKKRTTEGSNDAQI
jgi:antitoxin component YwqK of YwqJK toxin-antitoxin module